MSLDATPTGERTERGIGESARKAASRMVDPRTIGLGLEGGLIATIAMTVFREPISRSPPPTANFLATYVGGGGPNDYALSGLLLHLAYGAFFGGVFASLFATRNVDSEAANERRGVLWGLAYGLVLSVFGTRVVLTRLLDMDLEPDERLVFHVGHVVYGLALGTWLGSRLAAPD